MAKVIVPVESFTILILILLLLQSEFVNILLFMQNKIILFFKYKISHLQDSDHAILFYFVLFSWLVSGST